MNRIYNNNRRWGYPRNSATQEIPSVTLLRTKHRGRRGHVDFAVVHVASVKSTLATCRDACITTGVSICG